MRPLHGRVDAPESHHSFLLRASQEDVHVRGGRPGDGPQDAPAGNQQPGQLEVPELLEQALAAEISKPGVEVLDGALRARSLAAVKEQRDLQLSRLPGRKVLQIQLQQGRRLAVRPGALPAGLLSCSQSSVLRAKVEVAGLAAQRGFQVREAEEEAVLQQGPFAASQDDLGRPAP